MIHLHIHKTDSHSMKNALLCFTMMLLSLLPASGRNNEYTVRYALRLASVACDKDCGFVQPITEDSFADLDGLPTTTYRYKDDVVSMSWYVSDEAFNFTMINKSDSTMKLWWKDMSTRDINGVPSYISYTMEKPRFYIALDVPSHTGLNGYLIPLRNYPSNPKKDIRPLIEGTYLSQRAAKRAAEKIVGKDYHLYFPIHIGDEVYGYNLTFTVDKALGLLKQTKGQEEDYEVTTWDKVTESKGINFLVKGRRGKKNSESSPSLSQEEDWAKAEGDHKEEKAETAKHTVPSFDTPPLPTYAQLLETMPEPRDTTSAHYRLIQYAARTDFFSQACPQEKVYLHLDNTAYFQGETIWFAANVVGPEANGYVAPSKVLYVELLSPTGVVLQQQKLKVEEGRCHGAFPLVDTAVKEAVALRGAIGYPSGYYQIRAYTRAMLNFDEASIYSRVIPVYKAPDEEGQYANPVLRKYSGKETYRPTIEKPTEKTDKRSKLRTQRRSNGRVKDDPNDELQMTFYPEGGHLIRGVTCRIAFKATDRHGHGVTIDRLFNPEGQPLKLTLGRHGMGSFTLYNSDSEPITYVTAIYNGSAHEFSLPQSEDAGCALRMGDLERGLLPFTVSARHMTADTVLAYTVSHGGHVYAFDTLHLATPPDREVTLPTPGSGSNLRSTNNTKEKIFEPRIASERLLLSANRLPTGVCQFTLYGATGNIYAQRLFFVDNGVQTVPVTVTADKDTYRPFDPIMLRLQAADTVPTTFSLAVRDDADYGTANRDNILTYLLLSSELKGLIEEPDWYFREGEKPTPNPSQKEGLLASERENGTSSASSQVLSFGEDLGEAARALELLMMVQGWTRYDWRKMAGVEPFSIRHYTEGQLVVDGWAFSRIKETPLVNTDVLVRLTSPDRQYEQEAVVTTDSLGYWSVGVEDFEGEWDLYMETRQPDRDGDKHAARIRMERSSAPALHPYEPLDIYLPNYTGDSDALLTAEEANDPIYRLPSDAHLLDEVVVEGKRKYIDYNTFHAFDAEKDAELMIDAGQYTYKVEDYLKDKGYDITHSDGMSYEDYLTAADLAPETLPKVYEIIDDSESLDADGKPMDVSRTNIYYQWLVDQVKVDGYRTFWYVHEGKQNLTRPSTLGGYELDLEQTKSIIVYDDKRMFTSFAPIAENIPTRLAEHFLHADAKSGSPGGICIVDIELKPNYRRAFVGNNARQTTFAGYSTPVEFYAPTYPDGPIPGDKDYRRTIYWNPSVTTDSTGVAIVYFYNSGYEHGLTISAEGLNAHGIPVVNE